MFEYLCNADLLIYFVLPWFSTRYSHLFLFLFLGGVSLVLRISSTHPRTTTPVSPVSVCLFPLFSYFKAAKISPANMIACNFLVQYEFEQTFPLQRFEGTTVHGMTKGKEALLFLWIYV
mmetsp:Transcript_28960/g.74375  ORF Transcript_28960/g.74375 Transcript_28960/m.74375 type:complete len:119 (-) Transcript_28960:2-358(-)